MTKINKVEELAAGALPAAYDPYRALASAIVEQAVRDLRKGYKRKVRAETRLTMWQGLLAEGQDVEQDGKRLTLSTIRREVVRAKQSLERIDKDVAEVEAFFYSDWFMQLSDLDGPALQESIAAEFRLGDGL